MIHTRSKLGALIAMVTVVGVALLCFVQAPGRRAVASQLGYLGPAPLLAQASSPQGAVELPTGTVRGVVVDENGLPIHGIEVGLVPLNKTGDGRWYSTLQDWTDVHGQYEFTAAPGAYIVEVQQRGAPDGRHPYRGTYYPGVDDETSASHVYVTSDGLAELHALPLRRIETVTVKVNVAFEDGTRPAWSNLLFHNPSFPNQGVIGDEAPGIEDGTGSFTLPVGYRYYARAVVNCDRGTTIESRESRPVQDISVMREGYPQEMSFIIPGGSCALWKPKP